MAKSKSLDLDKIIQDMDFKTLLQLAVQNRSKRNAFSFSEYFNKQKEDDMPKTITGLTKLLIKCMEKYLAGNGQSDWAITDIENCNTVSQVIQVVIDIGMVSLQLNISSHCQVELAILLNGILSEIPCHMEIVKNSIAQYCEKLYATNTFEKCEYFLFNVLAFLLRRTLSKKPTKIDIKRIYNIRKMVGPIMELKASNREVLWNLFKQCAVKTFFVSSVEGQKVLGLVMALDIDKVSEFHKVIRNSLPGSNIKFAAAYGRVYFEAWCYCIKMGKPDIKNVIEITCLQDYILLAINTKHRPFLPLVRKLLAQFHSHKKETEVSKMLYSLYQPLLWRFLKNPDGQIRANATQLFLDIFPLEDPDVKVVATDLELNDQLLMIRDLLLDDYPIVRVTTILGICVSMSVNWEVFPEEMLKTYFRIIVDDLSRDSSSAEVRVAVVKGIKCLLENPLTVNSLIGILPKLQGLFHDTSENVRIAFCQLLLRVKNISAIKYFHIVPTKHLFARLEEDCHAVKKNITKLLNNSYFPRHEDPKVWLGRCLEIIKHERAAARVFFSYVATFIGLENSIRFMVQAVKAVHFYVRTKQSSGRIELSNKENIINYNQYVMSLEEAVGFSNFNVVSSLMDCITALWLSIKTEIEQPEHKACLKIIVVRVGKPLAELCLYYKDTSAWRSVFYLSSYLPASIVPSLGSLCFWKLKNLSSDAEEREYMTLLECLCNQQQGLELLTLLKEWIETGLSDSYVPPPTKKPRKRKSKIESSRLDQPKPYLANKMLDSMLNHRVLQKAMLSYPDVLKEMLYLVDHVKRKLERFNARVITDAESSFFEVLMFNLLRISVILHEDVDKSVLFVDEIVVWTEQKLIKHLDFSIENTNNFSALIFAMCKNLCAILADVFALGFCDPNSRIYLLFVEKMLRAGLGYKFAVIAGKVLYKLAATCQLKYIVENDTVMLCTLFESLCKFFDCYSDENLIESMSAQELKDLQFILSNIIHIVHNHVALLNAPTSSIFRCILKIILDSVISKTSPIVDDMTEDNFDSITYPKVGAFFMSVMTYKPALLPMYMKFLNETYKNSAKDIPFWIACYSIVSRVLNIKASAKPTFKECSILVRNLEKTLLETYPCEKDSDPLNSSKTIQSVPIQMFEKHCHAEFSKLKNQVLSKMNPPRSAKNLN